MKSPAEHSRESDSQASSVGYDIYIERSFKTNQIREGIFFTVSAQFERCEAAKAKYITVWAEYQFIVGTEEPRVHNDDDVPQILLLCFVFSHIFFSYVR